MVVLQLVVEAYDKHGELTEPNTQHSIRRIYASLPCAENEVQATVERVAALAGCEPHCMKCEAKDVAEAESKTPDALKAKP